MIEPNAANVTPLAEYVSGGKDDAEEVLALADRASAFLATLTWCRGVRERWVGIAVPGVVGVFLLCIEPSSPTVDEWLWVIVGDLPPAYLVTDDAPNPAAALDGYISEMHAWVRAVRDGAPRDDLIPVNAPATPEYADMLESRLRFLRAEVIPLFSGGR
jgi:hypothetical protein